MTTPKSSSACRGAPGATRKRLARPIAAFALPAVLSGCQTHFGLFSPSGYVAQQQASHLVGILLWMLPVVVPLFVALPVVLWRNRIGGPGRYTPRWEFSWPLEIAIWGLPAVVVVVLSVNLWRQTVALDPYEQVGQGIPLTVEAIGYDWKWLFIYPDLDVATVNKLVLPEDRPVTVHLTSATAMQSFSIPRIGGQIYAMPRMASRFNLRTGATGDFTGRNMQFNGEKYAQQSFAVNVVSAQGFRDWVTEARSGPPLDSKAVHELDRKDTVPTPRIYGGVQDDPFDTLSGSGPGLPAKGHKGKS